MTPEELQKIIEQFDESNLKKDALFGIAQYGGGVDESFIRANKEGLELFALELLKSARDSANEENNKIELHYDAEWIDENSDVLLTYIQVLTDKRKLQPKPEHTSSVADLAFSFGCLLIGLFLGISLVVGIVTTYNWLF